MTSRIMLMTLWGGLRDLTLGLNHYSLKFHFKNIGDLLTGLS